MTRVTLLALCLLFSAFCHGQERPGIPDAGTFAELYAAAGDKEFSENLDDVFAEWNQGPWAWRPASFGNISLTLHARPGKSRWTEVDIPFAYFATTPDRNHKNGKLRRNVTRRGVTRKLAYTVTPLVFNVNQTIIQAWATTSQTHGTPSYDESGKKKGVMGNGLTIQVRMDGQVFRGRPHWVVRVFGKKNPYGGYNDFETKVIVEPMTFHIGQSIRWHAIQRWGLDGSDGYPPGKTWVAYSLPNSATPEQLYVIIDHEGPNMMAVRDEPNTGPYRDRLGIYRHPAWVDGDIKFRYEDVQIEYSVDPWVQTQPDPPPIIPGLPGIGNDVRFDDLEN